MQALRWKMGKMLSAQKAVEPRTRSLRDRDQEELRASDDVLGAVCQEDEIVAILEWCGTQGRNGEILRRRLVAETVQELAEEYGLTVQQIRRTLRVVSDLARDRFSG